MHKSHIGEHNRVIKSKCKFYGIMKQRKGGGGVEPRTADLQLRDNHQPLTLLLLMEWFTSIAA